MASTNLVLQRQLKRKQVYCGNEFPVSLCANRSCWHLAELSKCPVDGFSAGLVNDDNIYGALVPQFPSYGSRPLTRHSALCFFSIGVYRMGHHHFWVSGCIPISHENALGLSLWFAQPARHPVVCGYEFLSEESVLNRLTKRVKPNSEGAFLRARMTFPSDYPLSPPELKFISKMWHPNIYSDGRVCISILHPPGDDPLNPYESAAERWSPVHTVESIVCRYWQRVLLRPLQQLKSVLTSISFFYLGSSFPSSRCSAPTHPTQNRQLTWTRPKKCGRTLQGTERRFDDWLVAQQKKPMIDAGSDDSPTQALCCKPE